MNVCEEDAPKENWKLNWKEKTLFISVSQSEDLSWTIDKMSIRNNNEILMHFMLFRWEIFPDTREIRKKESESRWVSEWDWVRVKWTIPKSIKGKQWRSLIGFC